MIVIEVAPSAYVVLAHVVSFETAGKSTTLRTIDGESYNLSITPEQLINRINDNEKMRRATQSRANPTLVRIVNGYSQPLGWISKEVADVIRGHSAR